MRYGYVSVEGWAALVCWLLTLILTAVTVPNLVRNATQQARPSRNAHTQVAASASPGQRGGPGRLARDSKHEAAPEPPATPLIMVTGLFGLAAIVLTARWIRNRLWLARAKLRAGAWTEGRAAARRKLAQEAKKMR